VKYFHLFAPVTLVILAVVFWMRPSGPVTGKVYSRSAHDSSVVERVILSDSAASPLAKRLVKDLLTRDLKVTIEKTGRCHAVMEYYNGINLQLQATKDLLEQAFLAVRPVQLYTDDQMKCFAYSITYHLPLPHPMNWRNHVITKVPLHLTIIHPLTDFKYFTREPHD